MKASIVFIIVLLGLSFKPLVISTYDLARMDIKKVNNFYDMLSTYSLETEFVLYADHTSKQIIETKKGKYIKQQNNSYVGLDDIETIQISDKVINLFGEENLIVIGDHYKHDLDPAIYNVDSLLTICSEIKMIQLSKYERIYKLLFDEKEIDEFSEIDIKINTLTYQFSQLVLFYKDEMNLTDDFFGEGSKHRLEINYKRFTKINSNPELFNENNYIQYDGTNIIPSDKYKSYRIKDLRVKNLTSKK